MRKAAETACKEERHLQIIIPIACILINVSAQIASFRYMRRFGLLKSIYFGFAAGILVLFVYEFMGLVHRTFLLADYVSLFIVNLVIYFTLSYCYFHFINLGQTARRIRILRELHDSRSGLSMAEILERYNAGEIVKKRICRMLNNNQIIFKNGRYLIRYSALLFMAKAVSLMKLILTGRQSADGDCRQ